MRYLPAVTPPDTLPDDVAALRALVLMAWAERDAERAKHGRLIEERDQLADPFAEPLRRYPTQIYSQVYSLTAVIEETRCRSPIGHNADWRRSCGSRRTS